MNHSDSKDKKAGCQNAERHLLICYLTLLSIPLLLLIFGLQLHAVQPVVQPVVGTSPSLPVFSVETGEKKAALTFDVAWEGEEIPRLLSILKQAEIKATFFIVGDYIKENPEQVKAIAADGHEIANHSDRHPHVCQQTDEEIIRDLKGCEAKLKALGITASKYYRTPYGEFDARVVRAITAAGYLDIQWSVDSLDWKGPSPEEITQRIISRTKPGDILLFHTGKENTLTSLPRILASFKSSGIKLVPVGALLLKEPFVLDHTGRQFPA